MKVRIKVLWRFLLILLVCCHVICGSAEEIDLSGYTLEELRVLQDRIEKRINELETQDAMENGNRLIRFEESELLLYVNQKQKIDPVVIRRVETAPASTALVWESGNPEILTVNNGQITPVAPGETIITAKAADDERIRASIKARVVNSVGAVTLDQTSLELVLGTGEGLHSAKLSARITPEDAFNRELVWTSSNENVVTVDPEGRLQAVQTGKATIRVETNDPSLKQQKRASCNVTVRQAVTELHLPDNSAVLEAGKTIRLTATVLPANAAKKNVKWESSNPTVASVTENGTVIGKQPGECVITCSAADGYGASASCAVTVKRLIKKISDAGGNQQKLGIGTGGEASVSFRIEPEDATDRHLQWTVSDPSVAQIIKEEEGTVTLRGEATGRTVLTGEATDGSGQKIEYSIAVEGECSVRCTGKTATGESYGYKWFKLELENASVSRTVDGVTIRYYTEDVYGEKIKCYGLGDYEAETAFNLTLRPGETKSTDQEILYGFNQAKTICAAVVKLHYTDGTIVECPEPEYLRFELAD